MRISSDNSRRGTVLAPPATRLYAIGDIHGRWDLLQTLLGLIRCDAGTSTASRRVVVFLGDYVDRGRQSAEVVEALVNGPPDDPSWRGFQWICLKGNHEDAMLRFLDGETDGEDWLAHGGRTTIESYSRRPIPPAAGPGGLRAQLRDGLPDRHRRFLAGLPLWHAEGDYLFVHAGLRPGVAMADQNPDDLMWIRGSFLTSAVDHGRMVVHGHSIVPQPEIHANRIAIDTGAYCSGRLTALVSEGSDSGFLST
ncbi:MAG TPA: serine/threonine protein phosphatase [Rhodospirillaceae bacterium]|nr:serine/threonine protein phosphatase [Rhodospirillaceae bacterium]